MLWWAVSSEPIHLSFLSIAHAVRRCHLLELSRSFLMVPYVHSDLCQFILNVKEGKRPHLGQITLCDMLTLCISTTPFPCLITSSFLQTWHVLFCHRPLWCYPYLPPDVFNLNNKSYHYVLILLVFADFWVYVWLFNWALFHGRFCFVEINSIVLSWHFSP